MPDPKINAAKKALEFIEDGMVLGLGTGSTVEEFLKLLSVECENGLKIKGIPTSEHIKKRASLLGIPLLDPMNLQKIHLAIDGADVVEKNYLIKGGGGALTREKIVAYSAEKLLVIADDSKYQKKFPLPIEITPFSYPFIMKKLPTSKLRTLNDQLNKVQGDLKFKRISKFGTKGSNLIERNDVLSDDPVITDNGNYLIDYNVKITNPKRLESEINNIPGVLENGLFTKFWKVILGNKKGAKIL